jgi:carboxypeptidase C (cathepsin A)
LIRKPFRPLVLGAVALTLAISPVAAQRSEGAPEARATSGVLTLLPADSVTEHTVEAGGEKLAYTATAGTLSLFDQNGERSAAIFYTAYALKGAPAETRPVTFVFNGGPGASSAYLHLGLAGPQVADFGAARDGAAAQLRNNPDTWLKFTDLVMIDPVGAGWSRAAKQDKAGDFWSVQSDAQSLAKAIALFVAKNSRTASPKYLMGESYGGFRAVKVARALQQGQGTVISGIVMVSPFVDGALTFGRGRDALGAALQLPSLAAAELDRRNTFTPDALATAEHFAMTDYLVALAGRPPEGEAARAFYGRLAEMTGLPVEAVTRARGFVRDLYSKRARDGRGEVVSPYDGASSSADPFPESDSDEGADYILDGYLQALGGLFVGYARDVLGFKTEMTYNVLNREVAGKWDWGGHGGRGRASIARDLRELLALNPSLTVLIAHGRSDLVTPYGITRYLLDHTPEIGADNRTQLKLYRGGHMYYLDAGSRAAFTADAAAFYRRPVL